MAGPSVLLRKGQEVTLDQATALRYIAAGLAASVNGDTVTVGGMARWEMRITPADYLQRFPTGPNAALARQLIEEHGDG
jgi:hypothetical protein